MSTDTPPPTGTTRSGRDTTQIVVAAIALIAIVWFAIANRHRVSINWWLFDRQSRLIYVIIVSAVLGALADRFLLSRIKRK